MNTQELERSISAAHERNDTAALERLQQQARGADRDSGRAEIRRLTRGYLQTSKDRT
jgi:hypothetical protein